MLGIEAPHLYHIWSTTRRNLGPGSNGWFLPRRDPRFGGPTQEFGRREAGNVSRVGAFVHRLFHYILFTLAMAGCHRPPGLLVLCMSLFCLASVCDVRAENSCVGGPNCGDQCGDDDGVTQSTCETAGDTY